MKVFSYRNAFITSVIIHIVLAVVLLTEIFTISKTPSSLPNNIEASVIEQNDTLLHHFTSADAVKHSEAWHAPAPSKANPILHKETPVSPKKTFKEIHPVTVSQPVQTPLKKSSSTLQQALPSSPQPLRRSTTEKLTTLHSVQKVVEKRKRETWLRAQALAQKKQQLQAQQAALLAKKLKEEMRAEQNALTQMQEKATAAVLDRYKVALLAAIAHEWIIPKEADPNLACVLLLRLAADGRVLSVQTIKSSGDKLLDRSAQVAVLKAAPLPVPKDPFLFEKFKEVRLTVQPQEVERIAE